MCVELQYVEWVVLLIVPVQVVLLYDAVQGSPNMSSF
jgi:hypothetical protein